MVAVISWEGGEDSMVVLLKGGGGREGWLGVVLLEGLGAKWWDRGWVGS